MTTYHILLSLSHNRSRGGLTCLDESINLFTVPHNFPLYILHRKGELADTKKKVEGLLVKVGETHHVEDCQHDRLSLLHNLGTLFQCVGILWLVQLDKLHPTHEAHLRLDVGRNSGDEPLANGFVASTIKDNIAHDVLQMSEEMCKLVGEGEAQLVGKDAAEDTGHPLAVAIGAGVDTLATFTVSGTYAPVTPLADAVRVLVGMLLHPLGKLCILFLVSHNILHT